MLNVLEWHSHRIDRVALCLTAPLFIALDRAKVCDFHYDSAPERTSIVGAVRVVVPRNCEATATSVAHG